MAITLKDVAKLAGVSESTASRALNDSPLISESTKRAVLLAARQLGYRPLRKETWPTRTIGVVMPNVANPLYGQIVTAIETRAYQAGYSMFLANSYFDPEREQNHCELLLRQGAAGLIIVPTDPMAPHIQALIDYNVPCVLMSGDPLPQVDQVNVDVVMGAYLATRYLIDLGHRRIALINGPTRVRVCRNRLAGYRRALEEANLPFDAHIVVEGELNEEAGATATTRLLSLIPHDVTAVYAVNDVTAIGALRALQRAGLRVPEDVSLVGTDDIPVAAQLQPALTTVWQPKRELGDLATKLLLRQIKTREERGQGWRELYAFQNAMYLPRIIERQSARRLESFTTTEPSLHTGASEA